MQAGLCVINYDCIYARGIYNFLFYITVESYEESYGDDRTFVLNTGYPSYFRRAGSEQLKLKGLIQLTDKMKVLFR